ncbi:hypothetical protein GOV12_04990 [Candidatus Pacearchaeota archaeon]|nr:hypothetical protein [Candidatus Pacearchaeota archaeon]
MATKKCENCDETIDEEFGKLKGTIVKKLNKDNKNEFVYVCLKCQKEDGWLEKVKSD